MDVLNRVLYSVLSAFDRPSCQICAFRLILVESEDGYLHYIIDLNIYIGYYSSTHIMSTSFFRHHDRINDCNVPERIFFKVTIEILRLGQRKREPTELLHQPAKFNAP